MKRVIMIQGLICSGKDYLGERINETMFDNKGSVIPVSHFVKHISNFTNREDLSTTQHLDGEIAEYMIEYIEMMDKPLIFTGCRQLSIFNLIKQYCQDNDILFDFVNIYVNYELREERWNKRMAGKDLKAINDNITLRELDIHEENVYEVKDIMDTAKGRKVYYHNDDKGTYTISSINLCDIND